MNDNDIYHSDFEHLVKTGKNIHIIYFDNIDQFKQFSFQRIYIQKMNNTVKFTSKYVSNIYKLGKTRKIVEDTLQEYEQKYGASYHRIVKVLCVAKF